MGVLGIPQGVASWRVTVGIVVTVCASFALLTTRGVAAPMWPASGAVLGCVLLGSGLLFYSHWKLTRLAATRWIVACSLALGAHLVASGSVPLVGAGAAGGRTWQGVSLAVLMGGLALLATRHGHRPSKTDLCLLGLVAGLVTAAIGIVLDRFAPDATGSLPVQVVVAAMVLVSGARLAWVARHFLGASPWVRDHLAAGIVLLTAQQSLLWWDAALSTPVAVLLAAAAAATVLNTATVQLLSCIADHGRAMDNLRSTLEQLEDGMRSERAALHEIRATVSGIGRATDLIMSADLAGERQAQLLHLIDTEAHRLERISESQEFPVTESVDLDRLLETLVLRQQLRGQQLQWQPSGHRALADWDDVAEIVSILLENSRRHAPLATTLVEVRQVDEAVLSVTVADTGPGVAVDLRPHVFEWGVRALGSPGQGIGLAIARERARSLEGDLELVENGSGATFRLTLPAAEAALRLEHRGGMDVIRTA